MQFGFPCNMDFLTTSRLRRGWDSETSGEKSMSHGKPYKMHFLAYFTLQCTLISAKYAVQRWRS